MLGIKIQGVIEIKNSQSEKKIENIHILYIFTFLFVLTFFAYANTLPNSLLYDDEDFIYKNVYVQNFDVGKFFSQNLIAGASKISNYYRPFLLISYGIEHAISGNSGFLYHLDSLLLHSLAAMLLFVFLKKMFNNQCVALLTASLFAIHPIQTEAVSYVSGRGDIFSAVFVFATLLLYQKKSYIFAIMTFILALLSKETALILPGLIILIDYISTQSFKKSLAHIKLFLPFLLVTVLYFLLRLTVLNFDNTLNFYSQQNVYSSNIMVRILTFISILPSYLKLLIYPDVLYIDRNTDVVTMPTIPIAIVTLIILIALYCAIRYFKKYPVFLFSIAWFFICFIPASGIIPINGIFYEHFLYLPSIGIFLLFSYSVFLLLKKIRNQIVTLFIIFVIAIVLLSCMVRTIIRNKKPGNTK